MNVYTTMESPVGELLLIGHPSPDGVTLTSVTMAGQRYAPEVRDGWRRDPAAFAEVIRQLTAYFAGDLTEFDLGTNYASATFNFIPNGSAVSQVRDVIRTQSCNRCHDQLSAHGGSRRGIEMCVLCHTPQTTDPDSGNTVDLPVMVHKIHMGSELPSVQAPVEPGDGGEHLVRPGFVSVPASRLTEPGDYDALLEECFGPVTVVVRVGAVELTGVAVSVDVVTAAGLTPVGSLPGTWRTLAG